MGFLEVRGGDPALPQHLLLCAPKAGTAAVLGQVPRGQLSGLAPAPPGASPPSERKSGVWDPLMTLTLVTTTALTVGINLGSPHGQSLPLRGGRLGPPDTRAQAQA